jgi:putative serine protease PepD
VNGAAVGSADELAGLIAAHQPGDRIALKVTRDGEERTVTVTLADLPAAT